MGIAKRLTPPRALQEFPGVSWGATAAAELHEAQLLLPVRQIYDSQWGDGSFLVETELQVSIAGILKRLAYRVMPLLVSSVM